MPSSAASLRWNRAHPDRMLAATMRHYRANKESINARRALSPELAAKNRERGRKARGMPSPTRPDPGSCEACGGPPGKWAMHLDHDHTTGAFRGWLCGNCNRALGQLKDSTTRLRALIDYLERARA